MIAIRVAQVRQPSVSHDGFGTGDVEVPEDPLQLCCINRTCQAMLQSRATSTTLPPLLTPTLASSLPPASIPLSASLIRQRAASSLIPSPPSHTSFVVRLPQSENPARKSLGRISRVVHLL